MLLNLLIEIQFLWSILSRPLLKDIKKSGEVHIVLDCSTEKIQHFMKQAMQVGMMTAYHNYLITSLVSQTFSFSSHFILPNIPCKLYKTKAAKHVCLLLYFLCNEGRRSSSWGSFTFLAACGNPPPPFRTLRNPYYHQLSPNNTLCPAYQCTVKCTSLW